MVRGLIADQNDYCRSEWLLCITIKILFTLRIVEPSLGSRFEPNDQTGGMTYLLVMQGKKLLRLWERALTKLLDYPPLTRPLP